jgi:hypothetical protein
MFTKRKNVLNFSTLLAGLLLAKIPLNSLRKSATKRQYLYFDENSFILGFCAMKKKKQEKRKSRIF